MRFLYLSLGPRLYANAVDSWVYFWRPTIFSFPDSGNRFLCLCHSFGVLGAGAIQRSGYIFSQSGISVASSDGCTKNVFFLVCCVALTKTTQYPS